MEDATTVMEALWYEDPENEKVKMTRAVWLAKQDKVRNLRNLNYYIILCVDS